MKIVCAVLLVVTLFLNVNAAPDGNLVTQDEDARLILREIIGNIALKKASNSFLRAIITSSDQDCMLNKYKEHNFMSVLLTMNAIDHSSSSNTAKIVFLNFAVSCSSKLDTLLGFAFNNAFALANLIKAFRDDEPLKGYFNDLPCYNNCAARSKWINTNVQTKFEYIQINETEEECDRKIQELKELANEFLEQTLGFDDRTDPESCFRNKIISTAEKIVFKYVILIPTNISDEQKKTAKINFVNDIKDALNQLLICSGKESGTTVEEDNRSNEI